MPLAVDASVAFKWFVPEAGGEAALALLDSDEPLWAPDLVLMELGNALTGRLRPLADGFAVATAAIDRLGALYSRLLPSSDFVRRAMHLSFELRHPIYDCIYLAMVEREDIKLVTADEKFVRLMANTAYADRVELLWAEGSPAAKGHQ
jgi:predicted nucleic acid-binding protein